MPTPLVRACHRFVMCAILLLVVGTPAAHASSPCTNSTGTAYSIRVCITAPADGAVLTSDSVVTATTAPVSGTSPGVQRVVFWLDGSYLLTDYSPPYTFTLPTSKFVDGPRVLSVSALMRDGTTTTPQASINLRFATGTTTPPTNPNTFAPKVANPPPGSPLIVGAVGDGAGGDQDAADVVNLVSGWNPSMFLYLGDVYEKGSVAEFANWFGPSGSSSLFFGKLKPITDPTIGNHEYNGGQAPAYFDYWDNVPHYYSFNAGAWHFISLDANSAFNQLGTTKAQYKWLSQDLTANTKPCTLVYYHQPLYNIGQEGATTGLSSMWSLFASHGVDLVVNGHDHTYQRWQPLDGSGNPSPTGVTEIIAGMGGHAHGKWLTTDSRVVKSDNTHYGALRLALNGAGADYQFVAVGGQVIDSGSVPCDPAATDTTPPTAPTNLVGISTYKTTVQLNWTAGSDAVGVTGNQVYRDGSLLATIGPQTTYTDNTVTAGSTHTYAIRAFDAAGNVSGPSTSVPVTTPSTGVLFHDGFESGDLSGWTTSSGLVVQSGTVFAGSFAAEASPSASSAPYAMKQLPASETELSYALRFDVKAQPSGNINLLRFRASNPPTNSALATAFITSANKIGLRNDATGASTTSTAAAARGQWHLLQVHVLVNGSASRTDVWLDGAPISALSVGQSFGALTGIGQLELSAKPSGTATYDAVFDEVSYDRTQILDAPPTAPGTPASTSVTSTTATISWARSSDDVGVTRYDVRRNGTVVGTAGQPASGDPSFSDSGLQSSTSYSYVVTAYDAAGNHTDSPSGTVTTNAPPLDTSPPTAPGTPGATTVSSTTATISWTRSSDDVGVARYDVSRNGTVVGTAGQPVSGDASFSDSGLQPSTGYSYVVTAYDAAGNHTDSPPGTVTTGAAPDTTPPTAPGTPAATTVGSTTATISWTRSSDDVGVARYDVSRNGTVVGTAGQPVSGDPSFSDSGLQPSTSYSYVVTAYDAAGNRTDSPPGSVATNAPPPDTTAPSKPVVTATPAATSVTLTWPRATDDVAVTRYDIARGGTMVGSVAQPSSGSVTFTETGLTPSTAYSYVVTAFDAATNSTASDAVPVTTLAGSGPGTTTLTATADAKVDASTPTSNFATAALRVDASPDVRSYIKFDATALTGTVQSATLRIWATSAQSVGFDAYPVADSSWTETGLTYANQPSASIGAKLGSSGVVAAGTWKTIDVTALVTGAGTYSIVLETTSATALALSSREDATHAPQLVVTTT